MLKNRLIFDLSEIGDSSKTSGGGTSTANTADKAFTGENSNIGANDSAILAGIIIGIVVVQTILITVCFFYRLFKVVFAVIGIVVLGVLGYFTYKLGTDLLLVANAPLDYITFFFFTWNWAAVGLIVVFMQVPDFLAKVYLVVLSSLMAFSFSSLPALVTWILLALLAVWDLVAVLCPFGPLRLLIESSKNNDQEIPALLYSNATWMMASMEVESQSSTLRPRKPSNSSLDEPQLDQKPTISDSKTEDNLRLPPAPDAIELQELPRAGPPPQQNTVDQEETIERSGLKLGLGDFVFYSVLVGRAGIDFLD